jgi:hypothetical protein
MVLLAEMFDDHMKAIGIITVRWSSVDGVIHEILRDRLLSPVEAEKIRYLNAGVNRLEYFRTQLKPTSLRAKEKAVLSAAVTRLIELCKERNMIVHGQYGIIVGEDGSLSVSYSDIGLRKMEPSDCRFEPALVTKEHLMQHADAVYESLSVILCAGHNQRQGGVLCRAKPRGWNAT